MKKYFIILSIIAILFSSCGSLGGLLGTGTGTNSSTATNPADAGKVLTDILSGVFGGQTLSVQNMVGTWSYTGTSAAFESDDLLKKAGGAVVASQVEKQLDKSVTQLGVKPTNTYFTFNADSTYSAKVGGISLSGKFTVNPTTKKIRLTYLMGLGSIDGNVVLTGRNMQLLFEADSMLKLMKLLSQFTQVTAVEVLGKMADMYDGMLLGFDLGKKQ